MTVEFAEKWERARVLRVATRGWREALKSHRKEQMLLIDSENFAYSCKQSICGARSNLVGTIKKHFKHWRRAVSKTSALSSVADGVVKKINRRVISAAWMRWRAGKRERQLENLKEYYDLGKWHSRADFALRRWALAFKVSGRLVP